VVDYLRVADRAWPLLGRVMSAHARLYRTYQVWLQGPGRSPVPAGSSFMRYGTVDVRCPVHRGDRLLVTIEPAGGSPRPTRPPLIVARPA